MDDAETVDRLTFECGNQLPSPAETLEAQDLHQRIKKAVGTLPTEQREVFLMRMEADLPFKDIAKIQNTSINTALARMTYALDKLRKVLADDFVQLQGV